MFPLTTPSPSLRNYHKPILDVQPNIAGARPKVPNLKIRSLLAVAISLVVSGVLFLLDFMNITIALTAVIYLSIMIIYLREKTILKHATHGLILAAIGIAIALLLGVRKIDYLFFIAAALTAAGAHMNIIVQYLPKRPDLAGGHLCHFGFGLMLVGILASSAFSVNEQVVIDRNSQSSAFDYAIAYHGTGGNIMQKDNEILLTLEKNGKQVDARPKFFYIERMESMMKKPYIKKSLFYDLYISPQDIQEMQHSPGLKLRKGESAKVGNYDFKLSTLTWVRTR